MLPRPLRSTRTDPLFPSTTLVRSRCSTDVVGTDICSAVDCDAAAYTRFRRDLLLGAGVDPLTAAYLAANPTIVLPDGSSANPLAGLKAFQFLPPFLNVPNAVEPGDRKSTR